MDEAREEREELAALDREVEDLRREQEAEERWYEPVRPESKRERMSEARPYSKAQQLSRGTKRYRRKVASPKQWQAIQSAKVGPCRVCCDPGRNGGAFGRITLHHIVPRDFHGDDTAENIVPLCFDCHELVTHRDREACRVLCASLSDAEYAYAIQKLGESVFERCYGITYERGSA